MIPIRYKILYSVLEKWIFKYFGWSFYDDIIYREDSSFWLHFRNLKLKLKTRDRVLWHLRIYQESLPTALGLLCFSKFQITMFRNLLVTNDGRLSAWIRWRSRGRSSPAEVQSPAELLDLFRLFNVLRRDISILTSFEDFWEMKIFLGLIFGLEGEVVRKTFIERKCATVPPSDRIDCGYEGKNIAFSKKFQWFFYESIKMPSIPMSLF